MNGRNGYAVFFYPQALEALGEAIKPYLRDGPAGQHVPCDEIDTAGALIEMTLHGRSADGADVSLEVMVPGSMVRMIVSTQGDGSFGFGPRSPEQAPHATPVVGPTAQPASAAPAAVPEGGAVPVPPAAPAPAGAPAPEGATAGKPGTP